MSYTTVDTIVLQLLHTMTYFFIIRIHPRSPPTKHKIIPTIGPIPKRPPRQHAAPAKVSAMFSAITGSNVGSFFIIVSWIAVELVSLLAGPNVKEGLTRRKNGDRELKFYYLNTETPAMQGFLIADVFALICSYLTSSIV